MTQLLRKFTTIMWKNFVVRKRHWFMTILELSIPLILFYFLTFVHNQIPTQIQPGNDNSTAANKVQIPLPKSESEIIELLFVHHDVLILAYTPVNPFTTAIMGNVQNILNKIIKTRPYYTHTKGINVTQCSSEKDLEKYFSTVFANTTENNYLGYGIVFTDNDHANFRYKLRSSASNWRTDRMFDPFKVIDQYMYQGFTAMQLAVDKAFIEEVTQAPPTVNVVLQQFPFIEKDFGDAMSIFYQNVMPVFAMLSFILIGPPLLRKIVEEKQTGIKELMKMLGLKTWMIWTGWMINAMMVYIITSVVITVLLCVDLAGKGAVISYTSPSIVFILFVLFCMASVSFTFIISAFFYKPTIAISVGVVIYLVSYFGISNYDNSSLVLQLLSCIIPTIGMKNCLFVILTFEKTRTNLSWINIFSDGLGGHRVSLGLLFGLFILYTILYLIVAWYVDSLFPGPFGRAKSWNFIFQWRKNNLADKEGIFQDDNNEANFEPAPTDLNVGISIRNLRKVFPPNVVAVDGVNLEIYEGQITALLGHNGAGKTTAMSIITGMFSPTSGSVYANNYNIFERMDDFRSSLGLCPQHNLLFSYLSVIEHLIFFGMIKGLSLKQSEKDGMSLLRLLNIAEKKSVMVAKLSGGMKRKLSLAIALIGNPKVLMLDEPTSGMDPESRRELWDLLLAMRGERTIIITTHFMEEADVLGDRIAIMDHGRVRCYGTTIFLKKLYGTGYQLTLLKEPSALESNITSVITGVIDRAEAKSSYQGQIVYKLPQESSKHFPALFHTLEVNKSSLGIKGMGLSCTTMEEVFLKVGEMAKDEQRALDKISLPSRDHTIHRHNSDEALTYRKITGISLLIKQLKCLIYKKMLYTKRKWLGSLHFVVLPLLMLLITVRTNVLGFYDSESEPPLELKLSDYGYLPPDTYISADQGNQLANIFKKLVSDEGSKITEFNNNNIVNELVKESEANIEHFEKQMIVAAEFNSTSAHGLYSGIPIHSTPIALNLITQTILQSNPSTSSYRISVTNHPLNIYSIDRCQTPDPTGGGLGLTQSFVIAFLWLSLVPIGLLFLVSDFIAFPLSERVNNAKQIQLMTGLHNVVYWLSCFLWDYFIYILVTIVMLIIIIIFDSSDMLKQSAPLAVFTLISLLYGISGTSYAYLFSYSAKTSPSATAIFTIFNILFGMISSAIMYFALTYANSSTSGEFLIIAPWIIYLVNNILCLNPHYALISAMVRFALITYNNGMCDLCSSSGRLCIRKKYFSYNTKDEALGLYLMYLGLDWILYIFLILLIDGGYISILFHHAKALWIGKNYTHIEQEDSDVRDERDRVDAARGINGVGEQAVLTANGLVKKFSRGFAAVKGISFQVAPGECFGLLGVNGAGKTTTFRMLTGDEIPTAGEASVFNYTLDKHRKQYLKQIGYCPQFDGINEVLTGEEMLRLFAHLRGIPSDKIKHHVNDWIVLLGLEEYRNRQCGTYSGGNKRKLCTALALIGDPPVVFLDEPTSGVDPVSRRNLWDILARCQRGGQAIVLTSHSMEECEALCTRLTIMVKGRMMCIGSTQYIKNRYGQGYTVMIKMFSKPNFETMLPLLKQEIVAAFAFNCILKDEHKGLLHYHLTDSSIPLSELFNTMEKLKQKYAIVEDYTVSDTTLEQVFIAFAKRSSEEN